MSRPTQSPHDAFLSAVARHLVGLEEHERRAVLQELADHVEDARAHLVQEHVERDAAVAQAIAAMGDPAQVGERLREEHLARGLTPGSALIAAAPLLAFAILLEAAPAIHRLAPGADRGVAALVLAAMIAAAALAIRNGRRPLWLPAVVGTGSALTSVFASGFLSSQTSFALVVHPWITTALALLACIGSVVRWSNLAACVAVLSGFAAFGLMTWLDEPAAIRLLLHAAPCIALVGVGLIPRRWHMPAAWTALGMNWLLVALAQARYLTARGATFEPVGPSGLAILGMSLPLAPALLSFALLLAAQGLVASQQPVPRRQHS